MRILDLFAGLGGEQRRSVIENMGHEYTTMDFNPEFNCDITADILNIDLDTFRELGKIDFLWASPPCEGFSVASLGHHWNRDGTPKTERAIRGMRMVMKTIDIIEELNPAAWIIENPRGKLRKMYFMRWFNRWTITYCQYGDNRMKPTDLWGVVPGWNPRPMCKNGDTCHIAAPRGSKTGTQGIRTYSDRSIVPLELWIEILTQLAKEN